MVKKAGFPETNDLEMIDCKNDVNLDDVATVDYNNDINLNNLNNDIQKIDIKKRSATQNAAKKLLKNTKSSKGKGQTVNYSKLNKKVTIMTLFL